MTSKHVEDQKQIPILGKALTPPDDTPESREISMDDESQIADVPRGAFNTSDDAQSYVGPTHWQAILETVRSISYIAVSQLTRSRLTDSRMSSALLKVM